jgi:hypothetical protein
VPQYSLRIEIMSAKHSNFGRETALSPETFDPANQRASESDDLRGAFRNPNARWSLQLRLTQI